MIKFEEIKNFSCTPQPNEPLYVILFRIVEGRSIKEKMPKKLIIAIVAIVAALVLALGIGITVFAADTPTPTPPIAVTTQDTLIQRAAQILGVTTDQMINAISGAKQALKDQKPTADVFYAKVAELLGNGITKDTLVAAMQQAGKEIAQTRITTGLDNAVKNGKITADEENQIQTWLAARPSAVDKLFGGLSGFGGRCWGFMKGGFGGMGRFGGAFKGGPRNQTPKASPTA